MATIMLRDMQSQAWSFRQDLLAFVQPAYKASGQSRRLPPVPKGSSV
jgi:hypothetical protein